jgi:hypothetical protein
MQLGITICIELSLVTCLKTIRHMHIDCLFPYTNPLSFFYIERFYDVAKNVEALISIMPYFAVRVNYIHKYYRLLYKR